MNRREFTKLLSMAGLGASVGLPFAGATAAEPYTGPFYINLAAIGGWDVTSFCDPKANILGERTINNWADSAAIEQVGNIAYAPIGKNKAFFERFYQDMMVINGIDTQTNSHDDGKRHTWSGRLGFGYPSFGAIASNAIGPELPLSLVHASGYNETAGIARATRLQEPEVMKNLMNDSTVQVGDTSYGLFEEQELALITQYQDARLARLATSEQLLPRQVDGMNALQLANATRGDLSLFADLLPDTFVGGRSNRAAQLALIAYQSGLCVSCQLGISGFDTHQNHDVDHLSAMDELIDLITYIFDTAEAGGFADKIVLTVASDFGRKPYYNSGAGKDHWPIGSALFIQQGAAWGNRVVGATDELHNGHKINPTTLQVDDSSAGIMLEPKHLQQAVRQLAGVENSAAALQFPLNAEDIDFFNPSKQTA